MIRPYYQTNDFELYNGDCNVILPQLTVKADLVFADPPYFLSNDGLTIQSGQVVSVNKGDWDKLPSHQTMEDFNYSWISKARNLLNDNGCIWVSGTMHNIYSIVSILTELNFKILNSIVWQKTNPPPNFTKRFFTHSTEILIWARKDRKKPHYYNYELMKAFNEGKQMKDVWTLPAIAQWEKEQGKHPVQKPLSVLSRIILSSSRKGDVILDPFAGSSTTGISANLFGRRFVGIDINQEFLDLSIKRKNEISDANTALIIKKINGLNLNALHLDV